MKNYYVPALMALLGLVLVVVLALTVFRSPITVEDPSIIIPGKVELPNQVLVVDLATHDGRPANERDIAKGDIPVLVIIQQSSAGGYKVIFPKDFDELQTFDENQDGELNQADSQFKNIYLGYLQENGTFKYSPLASAGIKALFLLPPAQTDQTAPRLITSEPTAVLSDSSRRPIVEILVGQQLLAKINNAK